MQTTSRDRPSFVPATACRTSCHELTLHLLPPAPYPHLQAPSTAHLEEGRYTRRLLVVNIQNVWLLATGCHQITLASSLMIIHLLPT